MLYILKDGVPIHTVNTEEWDAFMHDISLRRVAYTQLEGIQVSTVFLGIDHSFGLGGEPILYETMIFGGEHDEYQKRYHTLQEAIDGHKYAVQLAGGVPGDKPEEVSEPSFLND